MRVNHIAVMATDRQRMSKKVELTETRLGDRFEHSRHKSERDHVGEVLRASLSHEEGSPEEDLGQGQQRLPSSESKTHIGAEVLC